MWWAWTGWPGCHRPAGLGLGKPAPALPPVLPAAVCLRQCFAGLLFTHAHTFVRGSGRGTETPQWRQAAGVCAPPVSPPGMWLLILCAPFGCSQLLARCLYACELLYCVPGCCWEAHLWVLPSLVLGWAGAPESLHALRPSCRWSALLIPLRARRGGTHTHVLPWSASRCAASIDVPVMTTLCGTAPLLGCSPRAGQGLG